MVLSSATRKRPKKLAVIDRDCCTGCEACIEVCPVDCIELVRQGLGVKGIDAWCVIDADRCIGCELCIHLPRKSSDLYELTICPWTAIEMVATEKIVPMPKVPEVE